MSGFATQDLKQQAIMGVPYFVYKYITCGTMVPCCTGGAGKAGIWEVWQLLLSYHPRHYEFLRGSFKSVDVELIETNLTFFSLPHRFVVFHKKIVPGVGNRDSTWLEKKKEFCQTVLQINGYISLFQVPPEGFLFFGQIL